MDPASHIRATSRTVETRDHDGRPARVVIASRAYDTTIDDLWDALTTAERIPRWFLPITGELRLGGRYQLTGNAGGIISACEPPTHLGLTWEFGGQVSWVTVRLAPEGETRTQLTLEHIAHVPDEMWQQYGPGAVGVGWDSGLLGLDQLFSANPVVDPTTAITWLATPDGRAFLKGSSDGWCEASIASGTDASAARAAADRTYAAYTGS
ncbi:MAG: SRPBCC family protein [Gemmatimonadota bacterium]